jgi:hypothetical protein
MKLYILVLFVLLINISCSKNTPHLDTNIDGEIDVSFEEKVDGFKVFSDRNFDGFMDFVADYTNSELIESVLLDSDYDKYYDTKDVYVDGVWSYTLIDSNQNSSVDGIHFFKKNSNKSVGIKFDFMSKKVSVVHFVNGYPMEDKRVLDTTFNEEQFHDLVFKKRLSSLIDSDIVLQGEKHIESNSLSFYLKCDAVK